MSNEARYYEALKKIATSYYEWDKLNDKMCGKKWGISADEVRQYNYEGMMEIARSAIRGRRKPKLQSTDATAI